MEKIILVLNGQKDEEFNVKIKLSQIITKMIYDKRWKQATAAEKLKVDQPKISQIKNSKVHGFSLERLFSFLIRLDCQVEFVINERN